MGVNEVVIPPLPGVFSALGLLLSDYRHDYHKPVVKKFKDVKKSEIDNLFNEMERKAIETLRSEGISDDRIVLRRFLEIKYWGQAYALKVPYRGDISESVELFHKTHELRYGFSSPEEEVEIVVARLEAIGITEKPRLSVAKKMRELRSKGKREVYFRNGWEVAEVYEREALGEGAEVCGPAVIEEIDSTIVIPPGFCGTVDSIGSIIIKRR